MNHYFTRHDGASRVLADIVEILRVEFTTPDDAVVFRAPKPGGGDLIAFVAPDGSAIVFPVGTEAPTVPDNVEDEVEFPAGSFDPAGEFIELRSRLVLA